MSIKGNYGLMKQVPKDCPAGPYAEQSFSERVALVEAAYLIQEMRRLAPNAAGTLGITQAELARRIGVSQARISQIERAGGRDGPTFMLLKRIANACNLSWPRPLIDPATNLPERPAKCMTAAVKRNY